MSTRVIAKITLEDTMKNQETLLVKVLEGEIMGYTLYGTISRINMSLENMQIKIALPDMLPDYKSRHDLISAVKKSIQSGVCSVTNVKMY